MKLYLSTLALLGLLLVGPLTGCTEAEEPAVESIDTVPAEPAPTAPTLAPEADPYAADSLAPADPTADEAGVVEPAPAEQPTTGGQNPS